MQFDIPGIEPSHPQITRFRLDWNRLIAEENRLINGPEDNGNLSKGQALIVHMCTGHDMLYRCESHEKEQVISMIRPPQVEMEAVIRGRNRALAAFVDIATRDSENMCEVSHG